MLTRAGIPHSLAVGEVLHAFYEALGKQDTLNMLSCYHEFEPLRKSDEGSKPPRLLTEFQQEPRLICQPDGGFLFERNDHRIAYYLEREMGNTGSTVAPKKKVKGYQELDRTQLFKQHFPSTTWDHFFVLFVCPTANWRDRFMKNAIATKQEVVERWKAISVDDMTPERLLFDPIVRVFDQTELVPLLPKA